MGTFTLSPVDFLFTCAGLLCLVGDIVLDVVAAVTFYQEREFVSLGLLLLFLVGSSVLVQVYSWLWYSYEDVGRETKVEKSVTDCQLKLLHVFQLGIYVRHAGVVEMSLRSMFERDKNGRVVDGRLSENNHAKSKTYEETTYEDVAVYLSHDLSMLRLIETFSEGAPQFVLMLTLILRQGQLDPVTVLKAIGSASAIACSVTMYHRSLRSFLEEKEKQSLMSSVVYFVWNLFLISSRLTALALFASVLPCFIFTHFICSWLVLFFFAWRSKTDFMDNKGGEWLYRATVGLIWYFDWFNVVEGKTRNRTLLYHSFILADIFLLCGLWYWKMSTDPPYFKIPQLYALITAASVVGAYILGLFFKVIYYKCYHPKLYKEQLKGGASDRSETGREQLRIMRGEMHGGVPQSAELQSFDVPDHGRPGPDVKRCNKRMKKLAENFYS